MPLPPAAPKPLSREPPPPPPPVFAAPGQPAMVDSRNYARTGMNPMSYGQERAQSFAQPVVREEPQPAARPERGWFASRENRQPNNISYMPGVAPDSSFAGQTVHIIVLTGLKSCYEAIECMKNGETLIVTMEAIANEGESVRCQDMLAGAAFTLGALSLVGIPFLPGFVSKVSLARAALAYGGLHAWGALAVLALSTLLNVLYMLRTVLLIWSPGGSPRDPAVPSPGPLCHLSLGLLSAACLGLGCLAGPVLEAIRAGLAVFGIPL